MRLKKDGFFFFFFCYSSGDYYFSQNFTFVPAEADNLQKVGVSSESFGVSENL